MKKNLLRLAFSLMAATLSFSAAALAINYQPEIKETKADPVSYKLYVGDEEVTSDKTSGDGWSYDPSTTTLTLDNYTFNSATAPKHSFTYNGENFDNVEHVILYYGDSDMFTINVKGVNNINLPEAWAVYGIAVCSNLTIKGDGELNIIANHDYYTWAFYSFFHAYYEFTENVKITTRSIVAYGHYANQQEASIQLYFYFGKDVTLDMTAVSRNVLPIRPAFNRYHYKLEADFGLWKNEEGTEGRTLFKGNEPLPQDYDDGLYRRLRYPYSYNHDHDWSYTADGNKITAKCNGGTDPCEITEGLTLTLNAPANLIHDNEIKEATIESGYNQTVFGTPAIKYYQNDVEVASCVKVGKYTAKVTVGEATATVDFEIVAGDVKDPNNDVADVLINNGNYHRKLFLTVTVKESEEVGFVLLNQNEKIAKAYDIKLFINLDGNVSEVSMDTLGEDRDLIININVPQEISGREFKVAQINGEQQNYIDNYTKEDNKVSFHTKTLGIVAFVIDTTAGGHGFCIGWVALILDILFIIATGLYLVFKFKLVKLPEKVNEFGEQLTTREVLLTFLAFATLFANFAFDLLVLIGHACPASIIAFILGTLLFGGITFWYVHTRKEGEYTPIEKKIADKTIEIKNKVFKKNEEKKDADNSSEDKNN